MDSLADLGAALPSSDGVSTLEAVFGDDAMLRSILCCVPHDDRWAASRVCQHWLKLFRAGWHYWCKCGDEREAKLRWGGETALAKQRARAVPAGAGGVGALGGVLGVPVGQLLRRLSGGAEHAARGGRERRCRDAEMGARAGLPRRMGRRGLRRGCRRTPRGAEVGRGGGLSAPQGTLRGGNIELLRWLREEKEVPWDGQACYEAAKEGHLEVLQWARENGAPWDDQTCAFAAQGGHLRVLQWAVEHGCPTNGYVTLFAAHRGHLDVLRWALAHGCACHPRAAQDAVRNGHLEAARCAFSHGASMKGVLRAALTGGHVDAAEWAKANGAEWDSQTCLQVCEYAARLGQLRVLRWAAEHGCELSNQITLLAASQSHADVLRWAIARGVECHPLAAKTAAANGRLEAVHFAVLHGCSMDGVIAEANRGNHVDVVRWATEREQGTGGSLPVDNDLDLD
ncbi:hypothetical protein TrST_g7471 [Triparma strigata]|uniref:Ankyrin repeat domain containing protein n=1 Tax=Triparma strigata TaxID=1606541 RepID=A0A9W7BRW6_9STRA|nr:hypothetical protein TrST_g7471 [Triparma strigata]